MIKIYKYGRRGNSVYLRKTNRTIDSLVLALETIEYKLSRWYIYNDKHRVAVFREFGSVVVECDTVSEKQEVIRKLAND